MSARRRPVRVGPNTLRFTLATAADRDHELARLDDMISAYRSYWNTPTGRRWARRTVARRRKVSGWVIG